MCSVETRSGGSGAWKLVPEKKEKKSYVRHTQSKSVRPGSSFQVSHAPPSFDASSSLLSPSHLPRRRVVHHATLAHRPSPLPRLLAAAACFWGWQQLFSFPSDNIAVTTQATLAKLSFAPLFRLSLSLSFFSDISLQLVPRRPPEIKVWFFFSIHIFLFCSIILFDDGRNVCRRAALSFLSLYFYFSLFFFLLALSFIL